MSEKVVVVTTPASEGIARQIASRLAASFEVCLPARFADGNLFVQIKTDVKAAKVVIVQTLYGERVHEDFVNLLFLADAARRAAATAVYGVIPYFSYAKADKDDGVGTSARGELIAGVIGSFLDKVVGVQLHEATVIDYFGVTGVEVQLADVLAGWLVANSQRKDLILVAPDQGATEMTAMIAAKLAIPYVVAHKTRPEFYGAPQVILPEASYAGVTAAIVDDFTTTGQTLIKVSQQLHERGVTKTVAMVAHAPLEETARAALLASDLAQIVTTNTTRIEAGKKMVVLDASRPIVDTLQELL